MHNSANIIITILAEFSWVNGVGSTLKIKEGRIIIFLGNWPLAIIETWEKLAVAPVAGYAQLDQTSKNSPKNRFKKIVKLTSYAYAWTSLTICNDRKRKSSEFDETCVEKIVKPH